MSFVDDKSLNGSEIPDKTVDALVSTRDNSNKFFILKPTLFPGMAKH